MEAQQLRDRRRRRQALLGGMILALIAAFATYLVLTRGDGGVATPTPEPRTIVVAAVDIPARTQITEEMLAIAQVADDPVLTGADTDPEAVLGQVTTVDIGQGQAIFPNMHGTGSAAGLAILEPGQTVAPDSPVWRAVSVEIPRDRAVAGMVTVGDRVDLYVTLEIRIYDATGQLSEQALLPEGYIPGSSTKITWTNLEVLAADQDLSLYVFRVDASQAEEIAHVQSSGANTFALSLRPSTDTREIDRDLYGRTTNTLIENYGFPVPQIVFLPNLGPAPVPQPTPEPEPTPEEP